MGGVAFGPVAEMLVTPLSGGGKAPVLALLPAAPPLPAPPNPPVTPPAPVATPAPPPAPPPPVPLPLAPATPPLTVAPPLVFARNEHAETPAAITPSTTPASRSRA